MPERSSTSRPVDRNLDRRVQDLVLDQARARPDAIAVEFGEERLTYAQLAERSAMLAGRLRAVGVGRGEIVAIGLDRSPLQLLAVLAVHRAGAAFLPLDPAYPAQRRKLLIADARPRFALADTGDDGVFAMLGVDTLAIGDHDVGSIASCADPDAPGEADDLAYVIYTSGSTGRPKGVLVPHRGW